MDTTPPVGAVVDYRDNERHRSARLIVVAVSRAAMRRLIGMYRMWWGWCPDCNSDAPAINTCPVCRGDREGKTRAEWWWRFEELRLSE